MLDAERRTGDHPHDGRGGRAILGGVRVVEFLLSRVVSRVRGEDGQGMAEYALILSLISVVAIVALLFLSGALNGLIEFVGDCLQYQIC